MPNPKLAFALEQLGPGDWQAFENFAAEFLVTRYPNLRTTASPRGDRGRDGELYVVDGIETALQYSVAKDWRSKINNTVSRLAETMPSIRELVYATSQQIGPDADELKTRLWRENKLMLDICDRTWFVDRELTEPQRITASEELIALKLRPLLVERKIADGPGPTLQAGENRLALLHLSLDAADRASQKGLTRASFESLVLAALHGTNVDHPIPEAEVTFRVRAMLPAGSDQQVRDLTTSALGRLSRKLGPVHKIVKSGFYHMAFQEEQRLEEQAAKFLLDQRDLENQLVSELEAITRKPLDQHTATATGVALRIALEGILLHKGELFAMASSTGQVVPIFPDEIIAGISSESVPGGVTPAEVAASATAVLGRPLGGVKAHLRRLADAYTMFAFLRQTPDVQKVVVKLFADGDIWLDTSIILPLLAETLVEDVSRRPFSLTLRAAQKAGMRLFVTDGVIEEVERHLNRAATFSSIDLSRWRGRVPYIYAAYSDSGRARGVCCVG